MINYHNATIRLWYLYQCRVKLDSFNSTILFGERSLHLISIGTIFCHLFAAFCEHRCTVAASCGRRTCCMLWRDGHSYGQRWGGCLEGSSNLHRHDHGWGTSPSLFSVGATDTFLYEYNAGLVFHINCPGLNRLAQELASSVEGS